VERGALGHVHTGRALYGNAGSPWSRWYHESGVGPLAEAGIYNVKSLTALLGPAVAVQAAETAAVAGRADPDVAHAVIRHSGGALSSVVASQAVQRYRRPAIELYGTAGSANLLGDDWDPRGYEVWRNETGAWEEREAIEPTWHWADGLREAVLALREGRPPLMSHEHDLHVLEILEAARVAAATRREVPVGSTFGPLALDLEPPSGLEHVHDHTRPLDEQH
jgi:predicted dehydrogenase